jgi:hypothetical protein
VRQIFPFSSIRTITVGFGIAPNLLTRPIARRALAGFGDRSPIPPVGTFTPPRERGQTEIRPIQLTHPSPNHATLFASSAARFRQWRPHNVPRAPAGRTSREIRHRKPIGDTGTKLAAFLPSPASEGWSRPMLIAPPSARGRRPALAVMFGHARQFEPAMQRLFENCRGWRKIEVL